MQTDEYKLWFDRAEDNLKWAKDGLKEGSHPLVCFLSQQAVELSLKGFLYFKEIIPNKTHDLAYLNEVSAKNGLNLKKGHQEALNKLTDYYFETRYPDMFDEKINQKKVAKEALEFAKEIVDEVKKQIPNS